MISLSLLVISKKDGIYQSGMSDVWIVIYGLWIMTWNVIECVCNVVWFWWCNVVAGTL